ncbi:MAG: DUF4268 domain-containing protein [Fimbriimonadaceae bacterium]
MGAGWVRFPHVPANSRETNESTAKKRVESLSKIFRIETQFSDWLASEEGAETIADELGISIENTTRESRPGDFPCDIVGNLVGDEDHVIIIENQFGRTDHDHLGKLLTYAASHRAMTGVWIAERVANDHRTVVDWLNANTPENVSFFLVEVSAFTIGDSDPALHFDIISRPNFDIKTARTGTSEKVQERNRWRLQFWEDISDEIGKSNPPFRLQSPSTNHWSSISVGISGIHINMLITPGKGTIGLDVYLQPDGWKEEAFAQLEEKRSIIESELGSRLEWMPLPDKKSARILWEVEINPDHDENREEVIRWFVENTPRFYLAFRKHIDKLKRPQSMK